MFVHRVAHLTEVVDIDHPDEDTHVYAVVGELLWASSNDLVYQFDYVGDPTNVIIDMSRSHIWDASTVAALDAITTKYAAKGQDRHHHRPERGQRRAPRAPGWPPRRRPLSTGRLPSSSTRGGPRRGKTLTRRDDADLPAFLP